jgi:bacterioferritin-associated ferredoxin
MIVCSCNVFSENEIRRVLASAVRPPRVSQVYACLGYARQCGRCVRTIRKIMLEAYAAPLLNAAQRTSSSAISGHHCSATISRAGSDEC